MIAFAASAITFGLCCALIGVVYAVVLAGEDNPGNAWFSLLSRMRDAGGWRSWIASPLGGCAKCFSGQLALWTSSFVTPWALDPISVGYHLVAACSAVIFAETLSHCYRWLRNQI